MNAGCGEIGYLRWWVGWLLAQRSVWPVTVVVGDVLGQDARQVPFADDEYPVGALTPHCTDPAFRESVGPRRLWRCAEHVDTNAA